MSLRRFDGDEPTERHDHFDADGNLTGYTIVTREPEWDERARTEAIASVYADWGRCPKCGQSAATERDTLFRETRTWTWLDGRQWETFATRCLGCAAIETAERRWRKKYEKHTPTPGVYAPYDGVTWHVEPL